MSLLVLVYEFLSLHTYLCIYRYQGGCLYFFFFFFFLEFSVNLERRIEEHIHEFHSFAV